jgi:predicted transcriptional regulator
MSVVTLRLPDDLKERLQSMAKSRGESLNHLIESIATQALVAEETTRRIRLRRERGSAARALAVLDRVPDRPLLRRAKIEP